MLVALRQSFYLYDRRATLRRLVVISLFASVMWATACNKAPEQAAPSKSNAPANPNFVRLDPGFDQLVPANATIDRVANGFQFLEGPLWRPSGNLWFSDLVGNILYQTTPDGMVKELLNPAGDYRKDPPKGG